MGAGDATDASEDTGVSDNTGASGTQNFARATGIPWEEWTLHLEQAGGSSLDHQELARVAGALIEERGECSNPDWWAQSVAVAFERHIGRRTTGQVGDSTFQASCSRTLVGSLDQVADAWAGWAGAGRLPLGASLSLQGKPRLSSTEKWRYWRCDLSDGTRLVVTVGRSPRPDRSVLTIVQEGLPSAESRERSRDAWRAVLKDVAVPQH